MTLSTCPPGASHVLEDSAERRRHEFNDGPLFNAVHLEIVIQMSSTIEGQAAADKEMVDTFGAQAYRMFGQRPALQLVTASNRGQLLQSTPTIRWRPIAGRRAGTLH